MHNQIEDYIKNIKARELAMERIQKAGLPIPHRPNADSNNLFTEWENIKKQYGGIGNIPHRELGDFLDRWIQMLSYARWVEAVADIDFTVTKETRDTIKKQLYTIQEGGRELRDASVYIDPLFLEWEKKYIEQYATYMAIKSLREGYEYRVHAISREITRRGADSLDTNKAHNRS